MKTTTLILPLMLAAAGHACTGARFATNTGHRAGGAVDPNATDNANGAPLDVSSQTVNAGVNGPQPGSGALQTRSIELSCDQQQGAVIVVNSPSGTADGGTTGAPVGKGDGGSGGKGYGPNVKAAQFGLGGGVSTPDGSGVSVDKGGNPVDANGAPIASGKGTPDDTGKGGKGGKGTEPLPPKDPVAVPPSAKVVMQLTGKFCPKAQNNTTVLFVVDYSGSMGVHVDTFGGASLPGNDPQVNGSCGRLRAAQAIVQQMQSALPSGALVQVGLVPFAGGVVTSKVIPPTTLADFAQNRVNAATFCQYVVQDGTFGLDPQNPGGIDGSALGVDASTNYVAAFTAAQSLLSGVYGHKELFFISDGEPTSPGGDGSTATPAIVAASVQAGQSLRAGVDNLTFNALLLANAELGTHAQDILGQVAGSASQVVLAANADQLASQITQFQAAAITLGNAQGTVIVPAYAPAALGVDLHQDAAQAATWDYVTQPFVLLGTPGQMVVNTVQVTAQGSDGTTYSATVQIQYQQ